MKGLKKILKGKLTTKEMNFLVTSFDVIGDIAIIQIPDELKKKEKLIGEELMKLQKNVKVVAKPKGMHEGVFRLQKVKVIAGEKRKETKYKESGVRMKLNVEKTYFSPRFGTERLRIAKLVKPKEEVLVMFSGIAPFCLVITKNAKPKIVYGIEINPYAHKYAEENIQLNKMQEKIKLYNGDVRMIVPKLKKKFDRIIMPLPKTGVDFLDMAMKAAKKGAMIHFYDFMEEENFELSKEKVRKACKLAKRKCRIIKIVKSGQQKPRVYRISVDFKVY